MANPPLMPGVQFLGDGYGSAHTGGEQDNFQHVPPKPRVPPIGAAIRSPMFPNFTPGNVAPIGPAHSQAILDPHHYANTISGNFLGAAIVPFLLIQKNDVKRNMLGLRNTQPVGGSNLLVDFGQPPTSQSWLLLPPQSLVFFDAVVMQDDVWVVGDAAPWSVGFVYSTLPYSATS